MKRFKLIAAVGAVAMATAVLSGSSAYGGSSASTQGSPIKLGLITPLTPGASNFVPWGVQVRAGAALAVNEINRSGGVKGRGQGRKLNLVVADDQGTNTTAAIDGFRRLTQQENVVSVGGIIGSPIGQATTRLAEEGKIPLFLVKSGNNEILTQSSRYTFRTCLPAAAMVAQSVVQLAQRREIRSVGVMIADYAWGQSFKSSLEDAAKAAPNIRFNVQVAPVPTQNFTPYLRAFGDVSLIIATGHPPGAPLVLAQAGQLGLKAPVVGADGPWSLTAKSTTTSAFGRYSDFKCMATATKAVQGAREALPPDFPAERVHGGRRAGGLRVRQDRRGGDQQGRRQPPEDRRLRPRQHLQHPRLRVAAQVDGVGRDDRGAPAIRHPDQGRTARGRIEHRFDHLLAESDIQVSGR